MKRLLLALLLIAGAAHAQGSGDTFPMVLNYDADATSLTYCRYITSTSGLAEGPGAQVLEKVSTSGSSTTVAAVSAATTAPYTAVAVGDLIDFVIPGTPGVSGGRTRRYVTARASADSITVDTAVNIPAAGATFTFWQRQCGTTAASGWVNVNGTHPQFTLGITQMVVTGGIIYSVECKTSEDPWASINVVDVGTITAASPVVGNPHTTDILVPFSSCRVGFDIDSADDGNDLTTNLEQVFVERAWWNK